MIWLKKFLMDKRWRHQIWKAWLPTKMWWCQKWQTRLNVDKMATSLNTAGEPSFCAARHETVHVHLSKYINSASFQFETFSRQNLLIGDKDVETWLNQIRRRKVDGVVTEKLGLLLPEHCVDCVLWRQFRWWTAAHCFCVYKNCEESTLHTCWTHHLSQNALQSNFM